LSIIIIIAIIITIDYYFNFKYLSINTAVGYKTCSLDNKEDSNPSGGNAYSSSFSKCECKISATPLAASPTFPPSLIPL
jgi:hypothetical protein